MLEPREGQGQQHQHPHQSHHLIEEERPILEVVLDEVQDEVALEEVEVDIPEATTTKATMARMTTTKMRVTMVLQGRAMLDGKSPATQIDTLSQM